MHAIAEFPPRAQPCGFEPRLTRPYSKNREYERMKNEGKGIMKRIAEDGGKNERKMDERNERRGG